MQLVKVVLINNKKFYFPRQDDIFFGVIFCEDEDHITLKCFCPSDQGIAFGVIYRFMKMDVRVIPFDEKTLTFGGDHAPR